MTSFEQTVEAYKRSQAAKEDKIPWKPGFTGDTSGNVSTSRPYEILVRYPYENSPAIPVLDLIGVARVPNLAVKVGYLPWMPGVRQILAVDDQRLNPSDPNDSTVIPGGSTGYNPNSGPHEVNHSLFGPDALFIDFAQTTNLSTQPSSLGGFNVQIFPGTLPQLVGPDTPIAAQTVDLTSSVPVSGARYALISFNTTTGAVVVTDGAINAGGFAALTAADVPDTPAGTWRSAAIALYAGQTAITRSTAENDFWDLRWPEEQPAGTAAGHTILVNGVAFTQRINLDFFGTSITGADDATNNATNITIDNSGAGWLAGWRYRFAVDVANADGTYTNKKIPIDVNTLPLVEASKCKDDLSDLRVTSSDGQSLLAFYRANEALVFNQANFTRYGSNPIITVGGGGAWDSNWINPHSVVDNGSGTLYMYYGGGDGSGPGFPFQIGLATSTDGLTWSKYGGNPIFGLSGAGAWENTAITFFFAWREGSSWYAMYDGYNGTNFQIGLATSSDGISWTRSGSNPVMSYGGGSTWDSNHVGSPSVVKIGSTYYMYYWGAQTISGGLAAAATWQVGFATSTNLTTWTKSASNPVLTPRVGQWDAGISSPNIQHIGSTWILFYQGNRTDVDTTAIGVATSPDGITWTRRVDNPFPHGTGGSWDEAWNECPVLYRLNNEWLLYYMGKPTGGGTNPKIGVMQFPDTRLWPIIPSLTSAGDTLYVYYGNPAASDVSTGSAGSPDGNITVTNGAESSFLAAAWDDESQPGAHAKDIDDASYTLHLDPAFNGNVGTFGDGSNIPQITVDARGLISAVSNIAIIPGAINVYNETASGDGTTTIFYLANVAAPATIRVYIDGIRQAASDDTDPTDTVTFSSAPFNGAALLFDYELYIA